MPELVTWDDIKGPASEIFDIWSSGGDFQWAQEAWRHLTAAGLTSINSHADRTTVSLRLMMLGKVYEEFCAAKWGENPDRSLTMLAESVDIDRLSLGLLAAKAGCDGDEADIEDELYENALVAASAHVREELFTCLRDAYGHEGELYARLCKTSGGIETVSGNGAGDDIEEDTEDAFAVTGSNLQAYTFITNGFN
jgi:hypothetical protein